MKKLKKFPLNFILYSFAFSLFLAWLMSDLGFLHGWGIFILSCLMIVAFWSVRLAITITPERPFYNRMDPKDDLKLPIYLPYNSEFSSNPFFTSPANKFLFDLLNRLFKNWPEALLIINIQQKIIYSNEEAGKSFGYRGSLVGLDLAGLIRHPDLLNAINCIKEKQNEFFDLEFFLTIPTTKYWHVTLQQLSLPLEDFFGIIVVLRDETFTKKLIQKNQDFVANASHQLQTPLAIISSLVETLQHHSQAPSEKRDFFLSLFQQQIDRMSQLVKDLLLLSKVERLESLFPQKIISLAPILEAVTRDLQPLLKKYSIHLQLGGEPMPFNFIPSGESFLEKTDDLPSLPGDEQQLYILFENLLDNAVRYSMPGKRIWMVFRYRSSGLPSLGKELEILVIDEGIGIEAEDITRITERFYRAANNPNMEGTGLGLAISSHIIQRHQGRLHIYSQLKKGSCFLVSLPISYKGAI